MDGTIRTVLWVYLASLPFRHLLVIERNGFLLLLVLLAFWSACHRRVFVHQTALNVPVLGQISGMDVTKCDGHQPLMTNRAIIQRGRSRLG